MPPKKQSCSDVKVAPNGFDTTISSLRDAIKSNQIIPYIQPIIESHSKQTVGGEILLRWNHPELGFISPATFISLAEKNKIICDITKYSFEYVASTLINYLHVLPKKLIICFNVSPMNFSDNNLIRHCDKFLQALGSAEPQIVLEITERERFPETSNIAAIIKKLQENHIKISLDDFGTEYANYCYLERFNPDYLKIDKLFIHEIEKTGISHFIIKNMISLARDLGCLTIAEGVENIYQESYLCYENIDYMQGYFFSEPMSLDSFVSFVRTSGMR